MNFIALRMLLGDTTKYAGLLFGITFTSFLVTFAVSYFTGLMTRSYALISDNPTADIWVMDPAVQAVEQPSNMPDSALAFVRGVEGVRSAVPLAISAADLHFSDGRFQPIQVIGVDDATLTGVPPLSNGIPIDVLRGHDAGVVDPGGTEGKLEAPADISDRPPREKPSITALTRPLTIGDEVTINDSRIHIVGRSKGHPRFPPLPLLFTTYSNAHRILPPERRHLSFVLVTAESGINVRELAARIEALTDFRARTADDFTSETISWMIATSEDVGDAVTMLSIAMLVGFCVTGVMMYMFTSENLRYYAILNTMGATSWKLLVMVFVQAGMCGLLGAGLGIGVCVLAGHVFELSGFPFRMLWFAPVVGGTAVILVCVGAALISLRQVLRMQPATFLGGR